MTGYGRPKQVRASDNVATCLHRTFRELRPGVVVCACGININEIRRRDAAEDKQSINAVEHL